MLPGVNTRQGTRGFSRQGFPLHVDLVSLCSKVHPFPTVIYSSISGGDLVILSERALQSYNAAPARAGVRGREIDNDSLGVRDVQRVTERAG